ncbi:hypothetical protein Ferp_0456 [Ferroglobus placidus DSM 10642]|uniref:Uncharacterized protein n=1 Tax=Ferroglobus placidus (strain DSM 10642 / AEDII12DO) TaxID=589924 RepID=D3S2Z8_FERPA|nr:hypothetical protein [Ferroglobus placidus]ADC64631.1 hypothetical protein Ferp_0456 [Ferroglobus placidus DSM 10642]
MIEVLELVEEVVGSGSEESGLNGEFVLEVEFLEPSEDPEEGEILIF